MGCAPSSLASIYDEPHPWESTNGGLKTPFETIDGAGPTPHWGDFSLVKKAGAKEWKIVSSSSTKKATPYTVSYNGFVNNTKAFDVHRDGKPVLRAILKKATTPAGEWEIYRYGVAAFPGQEKSFKVGKHDLFPCVHAAYDGENCSIKKYGSDNSSATTLMRLRGSWPKYESIVDGAVVSCWEADESVTGKRCITLRIAEGCDFGLHIALAVATRRSRPKK